MSRRDLRPGLGRSHAGFGHRPALVAGALSLLVGGAARAEVRAFSPPNGSDGVARFLALSADFDHDLPGDPRELEGHIALFDRRGERVPLVVHRGASRPSLLIAFPPASQGRLFPGEDYFLEIRDPSSAAAPVRARFRTGGARSALCAAPADGGGWRDGCQDGTWREALALARCPLVTASSPECTCEAERAEVPGGWRASCRCREEESQLLDPGGLAYPVAFVPAPGSNQPGAEQVALEIDRELPDAADAYRLVIEDVTDPAATPLEVRSGRARLRDRRFELAAKLPADRRYRVSFEREDEPAPGEAFVAGSEPHRLVWSFTTFREPEPAHALRLVPDARTRRVTYPTHLALHPHLRIVFEHPVVRGAADLDAPRVELRARGGDRVQGVASWIDLDSRRLHVYAYQRLAPGRRYQLFCTPEFAAAIGAPPCVDAPLGSFLTQPPPPGAVLTDVRHGARSGLEPADERWLPVRPTVLDDEYGLKERYAADAAGPVGFLGHVMLVESAGARPQITIRVDPAAGCTVPEVAPLEGCPDEPRFLAGIVCEGDARCPPGFVCGACPFPGDAGCPGGTPRCRADPEASSRALAQFCARVVSSDTPACRLEDALRCAASGSVGCAAAAKTRLAPSADACPTGFRAHETAGCLPAGPVRIELAAGRHRLDPIELAPREAQHWREQERVAGAPPIQITGADGAASVLSVSVPLSPEGAWLDPGMCLTSAGERYSCTRPGAVCGPANRFRCEPAFAASAEGDCPVTEGFRWGEGGCRADLDQPAFRCSSGGCASRWVQVDRPRNVWRLWWPESHAPPRGIDSGVLVRRLHPDGTDSRIPALLAAEPDFAECAYRSEPDACVRAVCERWREADFGEQRRLALERLQDPPLPAPHALFVSGYRARPGGERGCASGAVTARLLDFPEPRRGPPALFLRLPPGETPGELALEASAALPALRMRHFPELELRGLAFDGAAAPLWLGGGLVRWRSVQWIGAASVALYASASPELELRDGLVLGAGLAHVARGGSVRITNNLVAAAPGKIFTTEGDRASLAPPTLCREGARCVRPACRKHQDCRIPFATAAGIAEPADPGAAGDFARCVDLDPTSGIGRCDPGVTDLRLIADNVLLGGGGFEGAPLVLTRFQRNHFEHRGAQELLDASGGATYLWMLDNVDFDGSSDTRPVVVQPIPEDRAGGREPLLRAISIEGNLIARRSPGSTVAGRGPVFPGSQSQRLIAITPGDAPARLDAAGVRVVENRLLDRPGARAWSAGVVGGVEVDVPGLAIHQNVIATDAPGAVAVLGLPAAPTPDGTLARNLTLSAGTRVDSLPGCQLREEGDLRVAGRARVELCDNASPEGVRGALGVRCAHQSLGADARARSLGEPLPEPVEVDAESYVASIFTSRAAERAARSDWPAYEPALLGDVLEPRAGFVACGIGVAPRACVERPWWQELLDTVTGRLRP